MVFGLCLLLITAGCAPDAQPAPYADVQLTPYYTRTPPPAATAEAAPTELPTATIEATPAPVTHEVALQETISSIALLYGVPTDAILEANPDVNPQSLTVGTQLLIPMDQSTRTPVEGSTDALALELSDARCEPTPEGGLWCHALISNPFSQPADRLLVAFTISDSQSGESLQVNVPALLNRIEAGGVLPASAYIPPPAPRASAVSAELLSALPLQDDTGTYLDASLQNERITIQGRMARISVQVLLPAVETPPAGASTIIWLSAAAYDSQGRLLGARRLEHTLGVDEDSPIELSLMVYSSGAVIDTVRLNVEAFILQ